MAGARQILEYKQLLREDDFSSNALIQYGGEHPSAIKVNQFDKAHGITPRHR